MCIYLYVNSLTFTRHALNETSQKYPFKIDLEKDI